jgi:hypothetical protein
MDFIEEFRTPGHTEIDPVRFARVTGVDPIELAKSGCTASTEAKGVTDARLRSVLRDSIRGHFIQRPIRLLKMQSHYRVVLRNATIPAFANRTVKELIESGEIDPVLMYLATCSSGSSG